MPSSPTQPIPWANKMVRLQRPLRARGAQALLPAFTQPGGEWMAPDSVIQQVRAHYAESVIWLHDTALVTTNSIRSLAPRYLAGRLLRDYKTQLDDLVKGRSTIIGVLRSEHSVAVRYFAPDGTRCLVVDRQMERRMATYNMRTRRRLHTQDLGNSTAVYIMLYAPSDQRWKIESLLQELPASWDRPQARPIMHEQTPLPRPRGRDS